MEIIKKITINLANAEISPKIYAMQGDSARKIFISLHANSEVWNVPDDASMYLAYEKPNGERERIAALENGEPVAVTNGNSVLLTIPAQVTLKHGTVKMSVVFVGENEKQIATFPFDLIVAENPADDAGDVDPFTPSEYEQMLSLIGSERARVNELFYTEQNRVNEVISVEQARINELVAMRGEGVTTQNFEIGAIKGYVATNGTSAHISFTLKNLAIDANGWHSIENFLPLSFSPLDAVVPPVLSIVEIDPQTYEEIGTSDLWASISSGENGLNLTIWNNSTEEWTENMIANFRAFYPLKNTYNSELADVRVGANGTAYPSAGNAVRAQIKAVGNAIDLIYGAGKNIIDPTKVIYPGNGRIHDTTGELLSGSTWVFGDYYLNEGETYTVSKTKGTQFLCFYNEDGSYAGLSNRISVPSASNTFTFVAPAPMLRIMAYSDIATLNFQIEPGDTATAYEPFGYALKENMRVTDPNVVNNLLVPGNVTDKYIADGGIHAQKLNFTTATYNLVNPLTCVAGYLSNSGNINSSNSFVTTNYIPVSADKGYVRSTGDWYNGAFYDADKTFVATISASKSVAIPENAAYARFAFTMYLENAHGLCVYVGEEEKPYIPYRIIPQKYIEQVADLFPEVSLLLTNDLYIANGVKVDIHAQSITRSIDVSKTVRPIGVSNGVYGVFDNHIEITGGEQTDKSVNVFCEPRWGKIVNKTIAVHNVSANAGNGQTKKVLFIGDSKTDAGVYTQCLLDMFANDPMSIQLLGTRGNTETNRHEGRSGWSAENYCENNAWRGVIEDSPFFNPATQTFDFAYYMAQNGYDGVDYVFINLGTNDTVSNFIGYYHEMIDSIRAYNSNIVIGIWVPAPFATFGGYTHTANDNQTFIAMEAVISEFDTAENQANKIFVVPTHMNLNTEYDYPWKDVPYTTAKPEYTYRVCTDQIHEVNGYYKDANVIFGYIKHFATLE